MRIKILFLIVGCFFLGSVKAEAFVLSQWASSVIDYSSQYSSTSWSAEQALGEPNTFSYGDIVTAWAPLNMNGTYEYITLGFDSFVYATEVMVRETDGSGFVYGLDLIDDKGVYHSISGVNDTSPDAISEFRILFPQTDYLVSGVKIYVDTNLDSGWEEIDAVRLTGETGSSAAVPEPATMVLFTTGLVGAFFRRRLSNSR